MPPIPFDNSYARMPEPFYAAVQPEPAPRPDLIRLNEKLAETLGLDVDWLRSPDGLGMLSGNALPEDANRVSPTTSLPPYVKSAYLENPFGQPKVQWWPYLPRTSRRLYKTRPAVLQ